MEHAWSTIEVDGKSIEVSRDAVKTDGVRIAYTYAEAERLAAELGGELPTPRVLDARWSAARLHNLPHPGDVTRRTAGLHSGDVERDIPAGYLGIVGNVGKHWVKAAPGRACLYGWHVPRGVATYNQRALRHEWRGIPLHPADTELTSDFVIQPRSDRAHNQQHVDYSMTLVLMRTPTAAPATTPPLETVRRGDRGDTVAFVQRIVGAKADGVFGPNTEAAVKRWQESKGLVPDGIFGRRSWAAAGFALPELTKAKDPRAAACVAALRDADARWPARSRVSDGVLGDLAHRFRPGPDGKLGTADDVPNHSDHNDGNAVDITHDPVSGCTGDVISAAAILDARTTYVIWNRRIYNRARAAEGWRPYTGSNGHAHHCHVSVRADARADVSPWDWAP